MKNIYIILIFNLISCSSTIELNKISNNETQFVFFEKSKTTYKSNVGFTKKDSIIYKHTYSYEFNKKPALYLNYSDYQSFDDAISKVNKSIIFNVDNSFLRQNKNIIITKELMDKIGRAKSFEILLNAKTIFLIDKEEIKKNKILIREVSLDWEREE